MAYNSEAILQLRVVANGLNELTTALSKIERDGTIAQKTLDALERSTARASKTAGGAADAAEAAAKGFDAEGKAATAAAAGIDKVAASSKSGISALTSLQIALERARVQQTKNAEADAAAAKAKAALVGQNRLYADYMNAQNEFTAATAASSQLGEFRSSTVASNVGDVDQSKARIEATQASAAIEAEVRQYGELTVAQRLAAESATALAAAQARVDALGELTITNSAEQAVAYRELAVATDQSAAAQSRLAAAQAASESAISRAGQSLSTTRTSLYDASRSLTLFGAGLLALPIASAVVATAYQRDFATVERSLVGSKYNADSLKQSLVDLSEEIPVSFKDITTIAGAGAQLGIGASGLVSFTKVVSELTSTTNLSADAAEQFLGKFHAIGEVGTSQFTALASSLLDVGVHTAATEQQIATAATGIVGIGKEAGFTTPQIIGLAGALTSVSSSVRNPQLIRGTMTRFITDMSAAVQTGGPALEAYAKTAGLTGEAVQKAFGTDNFAGTFEKFIDGLDKVQKSGGDAVGILHAIGLNSVQDVPLLLNLANGHKTLAEAIERANEGWNEQYLLQQHFDKINDTLASKVKELGSAFGALFNDIGQSAQGPLTTAVNLLDGLVKGLDGFVKSPIGSWVSGVSLALLTAVGIAALLGAGLAKVSAGAIAITQAWKGVTTFLDARAAKTAADAVAQTADNVAVAEGAAQTPAAVAAIQARTAATAENTAVTEANAATTSASGAKILSVLGAIGRAAGIATLAIGATAIGDNIAGSIDKNIISANGYNQNTIKGNVDLLTSKNAQNIFNGDGSYQYNSVVGAGKLNDLQAQNVNNTRWAANIPLVGNLLGGSGGTALKDFDEKLSSLVAKGPTEFATLGAAFTTMSQKSGLSLKQLEAEFPSVTGEAKKLGIGIKETADGIEFFTEKTASAATQAKALNLSYQAYSGMTTKQAKAMGDSYASSVTTLTDFNTVIGEVQTALNDSATATSDKTGKPTSEYYDGYSVSLQQYTDQLNKNNQAQSTWFGNLTTLKQQVVSQTGDADTASQITNQLLSAGYSVTNASFLQQLVDATPAQRQAYIDATKAAADATAQAAGQAFVDAAAGHLISKDGSPIDSTAVGKMLLGGYTPAEIMQALNLELVANPAKPQADTKDAAAQLDDFKKKYGNTKIPMSTDVSTGAGQSNIDGLISRNTGRKIYIDVVTNNGGSTGKGSSGAGGGGGGGIGWATGGAIAGPGTGTSDSIPAWLSNGEYVLRSAAVRSLGTGYLDALNHYGSAAIHRATGGPVSRGFSPVGHYASGGPAVTPRSADMTIVQLSPYDRELLAAAGNLTVSIPGTYIAKATSQSNDLSSSRG